MKGLLVKDWKLLLRNQKSFFVVMAVIIAMYVAIGNAEFIISYTPMLCVFVSMSTITYDTYENGAAFLFTMPFSRKEYVREKYIFSGCIILTAEIISYAVAMAVMLYQGKDWMEISISSVITFVLALLVMGLSIPIQLKFGAEKSRVAIMIVLGTGFGLLMIFFKVMEKLEMKPNQVFAVFYNMNVVALVLIAAFVFIVLMGISYTISVKVMMNKEL